METNEARIDLGEHEEQMLRMFNEAWDSLSAGEQARLREEREDWLAASRGRAQHGLGTRGT